MDDDYLYLHGVGQVGKALLSEQLETNLYAWFTQGLLSCGGYANVQVPTSGAYGGDYHRLRPLQDPNYEDGQVWQGARMDWVWETGVAYSPGPIRVSGVNVGNTFYPVSTTGAYAHKVNYPLGQVVFDSPISTGSVVTCEHSYRMFHFATADMDWWKEIQYESQRPDNNHFSQFGSGEWSIPGQNRIQLPCVVIEATPRTYRRPLEVGTIAPIVRQDVNFHVLAESRWDKKQLHDIITYQYHKVILAFDRDSLLRSNQMPLDEYGSPNPSGTSYADWVKPSGQGGHFWRKVRVHDITSYDRPDSELDYADHPRLHYCTVRMTCEVDAP